MSTYEPEFLWPKHKNDTPYCGCKICWMGRKYRQGRDGRAAEVLFILAQSSAEKQCDAPKPLEVRVAQDISALLENVVLDGVSVHKDGIELPAGTPDLTAYEAAFEYAIKTCPHENITNLLFGREWQCDDCHKYFGLAEYKKIISKRGFFGGFTF